MTTEHPIGPELMSVHFTYNVTLGGPSTDETIKIVYGHLRDRGQPDAEGKKEGNQIRFLGPGHPLLTSRLAVTKKAAIFYPLRLREHEAMTTTYSGLDYILTQDNGLDPNEDAWKGNFTK